MLHNKLDIIDADKNVMATLPINIAISHLLITMASSHQNEGNEIPQFGKRSEHKFVISQMNKGLVVNTAIPKSFVKTLRTLEMA